MFRLLKIILYLIVLIPALLFLALTIKSISDRSLPYNVAIEDTELPGFSEIELPFVHKHTDSKSLPFTASAIIDIDNDGVEELFIGGGYQQENVIYHFKDGRFREIADAAGIKKPNDSSSLGALVLDTNKDGLSDILISNKEGIWHYINAGGSFIGTKLRAPLGKNTTPLSMAVADVNKDGLFDIFVSGYVHRNLVEGQNLFNKEGYGGTSALLINNGNNVFSNETKERGLEYQHNTFQATFSDFELDGDLDLIVAHDTGHVRTWINDGTGNFSNQNNSSSKLFSYPMGIGITDINNDGYTDFAFSNIGSTPPAFMAKGDLREGQSLYRKWMVFQADGKGGFTDEAENKKLADYEFGWGMSFEDLNLDGRDDLIVSQNYVSSPLHKLSFLRLPGRMLLQTPDGEFAEIASRAGVVNYRYSIAPLTADFNNDGRPDVVHVNISGKSVAFLSKGKSRHGYLKIRFFNTISAVGARVVVTLKDGSLIHKPFVSGEGMASDSSHVIIAGLGDQTATRVEVFYVDGASASLEGEFKNQTLEFNKPPL